MNSRYKRATGRGIRQAMGERSVQIEAYGGGFSSKIFHIRWWLILLCAFLPSCQQSTAPTSNTAEVADQETLPQEDDGPEEIADHEADEQEVDSSQSESRASDFKRAISKGKAAAVFIKSPVGTGSGFLFRKEGDLHYVATNNHVVSAKENETEIGRTVTVVFHSGSPNAQAFRGEVIAAHPNDDLAVIRFENSEIELEPLEISQDFDFYETMPLLAIGFPFGEGLGSGRSPAPTVTRSAISSLRYNAHNVLAALQLDSNINPGHSGGPILNGEGEVVGMAVSTVLGTDISFAIPNHLIQSFFSGTIGNLRFRRMDIDYAKKLATIKFQVQLADPFSRVEEWGYNRADGSLEPKEKVTPFKAIGYPVDTFGVDADEIIEIDLLKPLRGEPLIWYQFWVKRVDSNSRVYLPPLHFGEEERTAGETPPQVAGPNEKPAEQPGMTFNILPENLDEKATHASAWAGSTKTPLETAVDVGLPQQPSRIIRAGGGKYLLFEYRILGTIGLFDFSEYGFTHYFHFGEPFLFAAGDDRLTVYLEHSQVWETYSLKNFKRQKSKAIALRGTPLDIAMGSHNRFRVIVVSKEAEKSPLYFDLLDAETLKTMACDFRLSTSQNEIPRFGDVDDVASSFVLSKDGGHSFQLYRFNRDKIEKVGWSGAHIASTRHDRDGFFYTTSGEILDSQYRQVKRHHDPVVPSEKGDFYLLMEDDYRDRVTYYFPKVYARGNFQKVFDTNLAIRGNRQNRKLAFPVFFFSVEANYIAHIDLFKNRFHLTPFSVHDRLEATGADYIIVVSRPPAQIEGDQTFEYDMDVLTNVSHLYYELVKGPAGMSISSQGRLSWDPIVSSRSSRHAVAIKVSDNQGASGRQEFELQVASRQ